MEYLFLYLLGFVSNFEYVIIFAVLIDMVGLTILFILCALDDSANPAFPIAKMTAIISTSILLIGLFLPSKESLALMGGVYFGKQTINTISTNKTFQKVEKIVDLQLDNYLQNLKKKEANVR